MHIGLNNNSLAVPEPPVPANETDRLLSLSALDIDYTDHQNNFKDLAKLAAKVTGTSISLVNMIDSLTQWSLSNYGLDIDQMMRQDSVCQYTVMENDHFEVQDLAADDRFKNKFYVNGNPNARYYYGIPLTIGNGINIGALCVLDSEKRVLDPEKIEFLKIIANEIVSRLKAFKVIEELKAKLAEAYETQKKVAHDIRGPLGGIIGLASIIADQGKDNEMEEVLEYVGMICKSGKSILDLADEILNTNKVENKINGMITPFNLLIFKDKLEKLYLPQAKNKNIRYTVNVSQETEDISFPKTKLLQIIGNLISNSIKFTPMGGEILVDLRLVVNKLDKSLFIRVKDTGIGLSELNIQSIMEGNAWSTDGTSGEHGFGLGLALVKQLVVSLSGSLEIYSEIGNGTEFRIEIPM